MTAPLTTARIQAALESEGEQAMLDLQADLEEFLAAMLSEAHSQATTSLGRVGFVPNP